VVVAEPFSGRFRTGGPGTAPPAIPARESRPDALTPRPRPGRRLNGTAVMRTLPYNASSGFAHGRVRGLAIGVRALSGSKFSRLMKLRA
jgi:hypothetical protein